MRADRSAFSDDRRVRTNPMAAIVIVGVEDELHAELRRRLKHADYYVLDASDGTAAMTLLGSSLEHVIAILLPTAAAESLLEAAAVNDHLRHGRVFLLITADSRALPETLATLCDKLGVMVSPQPLNSEDRVDWDDVLDGVELAMRHFPHDRDTSTPDARMPFPDHVVVPPDLPRVAGPEDVARELTAGMIVLDENGVHVGQLVRCDRNHRVMIVAPHLFSPHALSIPFDLVSTVDPESMRVRLTLPHETLQAHFTAPLAHA
jgi:hypothetical protein